MPTADSTTRAAREAATTHPVPADGRTTELILRKIDTLPTLPPVAARLLALTGDEAANAIDVTRLIESDPALTAAVLRLCRTADLGGQRQNALPTIQRAVVLLGFNAIRHAVLTVGVFNAVPARSGPAGLDRPGLWMHSLAVAIAAERLARTDEAGGVEPELAFVAGLLHDLGKLALDHVLPQAYARVVELARTQRGDIAAYETRVLGVDHHRAGRRLAERWGLPSELADAMAFHHIGPSAESESAPDGFPPPGRLPRLVGLADALVRERHVGYSGNHTTPHAASRAAALGFSDAQLAAVTAALFPELEVRGRALGLHDHPAPVLLEASLDRAQSALGHAHAALDERSRRVTRQERILRALESFHHHARPAGSVDDAAAAVAESAAGLLGRGLRAILHRPAAGPWMLYRYAAAGANSTDPVHLPITPPPAVIKALPAAGDDVPLTDVPWIAQRFQRPAELRLRSLPGGGTVTAWLVHPVDRDPHPVAMVPFAGVWGNALAAAQAHESARRLSEDLTVAHDALARAQSQIVRRETLARLGELAAGAAHEMNNPLAVISGRSQQLATTLSPDHDDHRAATQIQGAARQLSDLISGLRMYAEPPAPQCRSVDATTLVRDAITRAGQGAGRRPGPSVFSLNVGPGVGKVRLDPQLVGEALDELLANALQAPARSGIWVRIETAPPENLSGGAQNAPQGAACLQISIRDDGPGMAPHTLAHATDPFFSARPAGRRVGMGLARAQRWAQAHGGVLRIESDPPRGTTVTLVLPVD